MRKYIVFLIYVVIICCLVFITTGTYTLMTLEDEVVINNTEVKIQLLEASTAFPMQQKRKIKNC